jgi:hypothetical protein
MTKRYQDDYPPQVMFPLEGGSSKSLTKGRREFKQRLIRQEKLVDKSFRTLMEQMIVKDLGNVPGGPKLTAKKVRGGVQKYVTKMNVDFRRAFKESIAESRKRMAEILGGKQLSS